MGAAQTVSNQRARCVLWHAPGAQPPRTLTDALRSRGIQAQAHTSPFAVLAEACVLDRQTGGGRRERAGPGVVLLVEPTTLDQPSELVRAVWAYAPRIVCWVYESEGSCKTGTDQTGTGQRGSSGSPPAELMRAVVRSDVDRWSASPELEPSVARALSGLPGADHAGWASGGVARRGGLRLSGQTPRTDDACGAALHAPDERTEPPTPSERVLTDDELAMLLAEDEPWDEGQAG